MNNIKVKFPKVSKLIALGLIISMLTGCASDRYITNDGQRIRVPDELSTPEQVGIGIGAALGAALLGFLIDRALSEDGKNPEDPSWDANGPVIPEHFNFSDLKIGGYVQGGWPLAIDYQLSRPASAMLIVKINNEQPLTFQLNGAGTSRQFQRILLPAALGDAPKRAIIEVHASDSSNGVITLVPIKIFGIACGNKAVGSIGIDQIDFGPGSIAANLGEKAHYSFFAHKSFSKVHSDFRRIDKIVTGNNETSLVGRTVYTHVLDRLGAIDESTGKLFGKDNPPFTWDGKSKNKSLSKGFHQLTIRAWYTSSDKDWVTAFSPGRVEVKQ